MSTRYDDEGTPWIRRGVGAAAVIAIVAFVGNSYLQAGGASPGLIPAATSAATAGTSAERLPVATEPPTTAPVTVDPASTSPPATAPAATAPPVAAPRSAPPASAPATVTSAPADYPRAADGSPLPVLVVYGPSTVTLSGSVPSTGARDRLVALAQANSRRPVNVVDDLTVNELVPAGVGVRVIELDSPRFPDGSAELVPEHAAQFDRVAAVMQALPHVTVLVIGHSDQRGAAETNWELSDERARSVVAYLTATGIEPARLSSRAAGETDLLTIEDDATSLALNRRTEFVFYGVLAEPA